MVERAQQGVYGGFGYLLEAFRAEIDLEVQPLLVYKGQIFPYPGVRDVEVNGGIKPL
ncbi:MAG: hypothetical protein GXO94_08780 [Nitrospirae bacterium]|nr:hypothetical protein [Nitrospirota bacterium]